MTPFPLSLSNFCSVTVSFCFFVLSQSFFLYLKIYLSVCLSLSPLPLLSLPIYCLSLSLFPPIFTLSQSYFLILPSLASFYHSFLFIFCLYVLIYDFGKCIFLDVTHPILILQFQKLFRYQMRGDIPPSNISVKVEIACHH